MRSIAIVTLGLFACADEAKVAALETKVKELEAELASDRKMFDDRIDELVDERKAFEQQLEDAKRRLDKLDDKMRVGSYSSYGSTLPRPVRPQPDASQVYSVSVDGYPTIGPADAKVTIVKAYDHACPYCERTRATLKDLRDKYRDDVRIVYKPLVVHPRNAMAGALATCAANKQGKFAEMDAAIWDRGFAARNLDLSDSGQGVKCWDEPDGCRLVVGYAKDLQLNLAKFKQDMRDCNAKVVKSMADFQALGVSATPGFFINGRFLSGAQPLDAFARLVDEELRKANERIAQGTRARDYYESWIVDRGKKTLDPVPPAGIPGVP